jgi:hypothetical protein
MCCVECGNRSKGVSCATCGAVRLNRAPDPPERTTFLQTIGMRHRAVIRLDRTVGRKLSNSAARRKTELIREA